MHATDVCSDDLTVQRVFYIRSFTDIRVVQRPQDKRDQTALKIHADNLLITACLGTKTFSRTVRTNPHSLKLMSATTMQRPNITFSYLITSLDSLRMTCLGCTYLCHFLLEAPYLPGACIYYNLEL